MSFPPTITYEPWPPLSYPEFAATQHFLHMGLQAVGKLKLKEPFEPQWGEVPLLAQQPRTHDRTDPLFSFWRRLRSHR